MVNIPITCKMSGTKGQVSCNAYTLEDMDTENHYKVTQLFSESCSIYRSGLCNRISFCKLAKGNERLFDYSDPFTG